MVYDARVEDEPGLLTRWRAGEAAAGSELFERYYDGLFRFFAAKVSGDVEDLIQQTFLACVEGRDRIVSFRAYLFGTARLILFKFYRDRTRDHFDEVETSLEDLAPSPSRLVDAADGSRLLGEALRRIPLESQVLLELHYWELLSHTELAEATRMTLGTTKGRLERAKLLLKRELDALAPGKEIDPATIDLGRWLSPAHEERS